jgi:hypothetical protein
MSSAFGGILGAALGLYVIHEILHDGRTGRKLGVVHARNKKHAVQILSKFKKLPNKVRVFHGKPVKGSRKKETHYGQREKSSLDTGINLNTKWF